MPVCVAYLAKDKLLTLFLYSSLFFLSVILSEP